MAMRGDVMDKLSYDIGKLVMMWQNRLHLIPDSTERNRADRRMLRGCIDDLQHVIDMNITGE